MLSAETRIEGPAQITGRCSWEEYEAATPIVCPTEKLKAAIVFNPWFDQAAHLAIGYLAEVKTSLSELGAFQNELDEDVEGCRVILYLGFDASSTPDTPVYSLNMLIRTHEEYETHCRLTWNLLALRKQHGMHVGASCARNHGTGICTTVLDFKGQITEISDRLILLASLLRGAK